MYCNAYCCVPLQITARMACSALLMLRTVVMQGPSDWNTVQDVGFVLEGKDHKLLDICKDRIDLCPPAYPETISEIPRPPFCPFHCHARAAGFSSPMRLSL